jgi:RNA polymerase sigma-70 factor (ECF subfamily)
VQQPNTELATLLRPHLPKLYRLAYRLTGIQSDAEDLVQDVLVKVCARADELTSIRELSPWLGRVLYNQFIDDRRRYGRMPIKLVAEDALDALAQPEEANPEARASASETQEFLIEALEKLAEDQRVVVLLHDAEGYKLEEIAELIDTPIGTVKSRLHRARARLAELVPRAAEKSQTSMEPFSSHQRVSR